MTAERISWLPRQRASGILLPIYSLPSEYGIGTMGKAAYNFVDWLKKAGQTFWQILPLGHTGYGNCPYGTFSSVAGNPLFIDLDLLVEKGLLCKGDLEHLNHYNPDRVDYARVIVEKYPILRKAYEKAKELGIAQKGIDEFERANDSWLDEYAMYMAIRDSYGQKPFWEWQDNRLATREQKALEEFKKIHGDEVNFYKFIQVLFFEQYFAMKDYANSQGIKIIGDIPFYVPSDSADVWANPELFSKDESAGVPPDYYSATGQLWGNPVYEWKVHKKTGFAWWINRIRCNLKFADVIRLDHFRAFQNYWAVPNGETTAINGKWKPGPRMELFNALKEEFGELPFIAEDLGIITDDVRELLSETGFPGMPVFIFGLSKHEDNMYLPHNLGRNTIGYTSTHDSETFKQWVLDVLNDEDRQFAINYVGAKENLEKIGLYAIRSMMASPAGLVISPIQDALSLGREGRMNIPGTACGNWEWRVRADVLTNTLAGELREMTETYKRC